MRRNTFAYWRAAPHMQCPLVVNRGMSSECRLVARSELVFIYHYTRLDHPNRSAKKNLPKQESLILSNRAGRIPAYPQENKTAMAKKATSAPMKAAPKKGAVVPAKKGAAAPMKKGR
jgi:hypothetical protein